MKMKLLSILSTKKAILIEMLKKESSERNAHTICMKRAHFSRFSHEMFNMPNTKRCMHCSKH